MKPVAKVVTSVAEFWKTRKGLWVCSSSINRILSCAKESDVSDISACDHIIIPHKMYDSEVIKEYLGGMKEARKKAFTINQIKAFIEVQWGGNKGVLLTNGFPNIFYVIGEFGNLFVISVGWGTGEWYVGDWGLDEGDGWYAGVRVFCNRR